MHIAAAGFLKDERLSPDEKRKAIDSVYFQMIEMAQKANRALGAGPKPLDKKLMDSSQESSIINDYLIGKIKLTLREIGAIFNALGEKREKDKKEKPTKRGNLEGDID